MPGLASVDVEEQQQGEEQRAHLLVRSGIKPEYLDQITEIADNASRLGFANETMKSYAPRFVKALKTASRISFWAFLTGIGVWTLRQNESVPSVYTDNLNSLVIAIIFNVTPDLASTVKSVIQALVGTLFAVAVSFVLYQLPDPHSQSPHAAPAAPTKCPAGAEGAEDHAFLEQKDGLFDWFCFESVGLVTADESGIGATTWIAFGLFAVFVAFSLSLNVVMPFKTFSLVGAVNFMMNFANPAADTTKYMELRWESTMVVTLVVQIAGSCIAVLAMMLPPATATRASKALAARATRVTAELLAFVTEYYCGAEKTLKINVWNSQLNRNREDMDLESTDLDNSWWESFDWGSSGVVRYLMLDHLKMLKDLDRRLAVIQICVVREGFEATHKDVMQKIASPVHKVVAAIGDLLLHSTIAASDGKFTAEEITSLQEEKATLDAAMKDLAMTWQKTRQDYGPLSEELRAESFFLLEVSTVGRTVGEFVQEIVDEARRPKPYNIAAKHIGKIIDLEKLKTDGDFRNFILRNWISLMCAWWWATIANQYATALPINVVFMLTEQPGNSLMMNLQKLEASVLGSLAGMVLYRAFHYCTWYHKLMKLVALYIFELVSMFIANYTKEFAVVGLLLGVYGGGKLMTTCDEKLTNGELIVMTSGEFKNLKIFTFSMCIVSVVDALLKRELACDMARRHLLEAMKLSFDYLESFMNGEIDGSPDVWDSSGDVTDKVEAALGKASDLSAAAEAEPRFAKGPFKVALFGELIEMLRHFQLNSCVLIRRCQGADMGLYPKLSSCKSWSVLKKDLLVTLKETKHVVETVVSYDGFGAMSADMFDEVIGKAGVDGLDGLADLVKEMHQKVDTSAVKDIGSLEDGEISRLCVVFEMLDRVVKDLADMLRETVSCM